MKDFLEKEFGFTITSHKQLDGYENINYRISTDENDFVYKTYKYSEAQHDVVMAENEILLHLADQFHTKIPAPIPFKDGSYVKIISEDNKKEVCRLLTFIEGESLANAAHSPKLYESLGAFLAKLDLGLKGIKNHTIQSRQWEWDNQYFDLNRKYLDDIPDARNRNTILYFLNQFEEIVRPLFPELRKQIIHGDANEWNLLVKNEEIAGLIDFGDLAHTFLINELAIAIAYACLGKEDPLKWAVIILRSYHQIIPLEEQEIHILYYLVAARLCTSVCNSAHSRIINPVNKYASVSEKGAWQLIYRWLAINPIKAENEFRKAAGLAVKEAEPIEQLIDKRTKHISSILSVSYDKPVHMVRSAFQYMYDAAGNTFLDAYNNIPHVGHSHPRIVSAGQKQLAKLNTNTRYLYDELSEYAEKLLKYFPPELYKVFFVNSGSAASDLAMRMAHYHTGFKHVMVMESGYHGNTQTAMEISDYKFSNPKGQGQKKYIIKTPLPDTFRGKYKMDTPDPGALYGEDAVNQIRNSSSPISAFISEPIVGCAGQVPLPKGYLQFVYPAIREQGGICISDEVQTGFGRLGKHFWGFEAQGVVPDMVILGKPIANGHPMGAVVCTDEIAASFEQGVEFFSSFGGNPVSCAIASAVLDVIEEEQLQENAEIVGDHYFHLLKDLMKKYPCIGDVRGSGLFIGIEIVKENSGLPDTALAGHIKEELRNRYILVSTDGPSDNVIKTKPPLCFNKENAESVVRAIDEILASL